MNRTLSDFCMPLNVMDIKSPVPLCPRLGAAPNRRKYSTALSSCRAFRTASACAIAGSVRMAQAVDNTVLMLLPVTPVIALYKTLYAKNSTS